MDMPDDMPNQKMPETGDELFSIGTVSRITGISEATLRVWERRYQFPRTTRSVGRHRKYSQHDVLQLQWVKMRIEEGMRAGRAIRALHLSKRDAAVATSLREPLPASAAPDPALVAWQQPLLSALLAYDGARATLVLREAATQHPLERVVLEIVGPTLAAIGDAWSSGQIEVATEHFASNFLRHQLLTWMRVSPHPFQVPPIVLACAPEEWHEGSLLMLGVLLRRARWPTFYLGQSLPLADLAALTNAVRPALIVFVAMSEASARALADWPLSLDVETREHLPIIGYGGRAFIEQPDLSALVAGVLLGTTLDEGYRRIHRVMLDLNALEN